MLALQPGRLFREKVGPHGCFYREAAAFAVVVRQSLQEWVGVAVPRPDRESLVLRRHHHRLGGIQWASAGTMAVWQHHDQRRDLHAVHAYAGVDAHGRL